jgi:hypothetical protein
MKPTKARNQFYDFVICHPFEVLLLQASRTALSHQLAFLLCLLFAISLGYSVVNSHLLHLLFNVLYLLLLLPRALSVMSEHVQFKEYDPASPMINDPDGTVLGDAVDLMPDNTFEVSPSPQTIGEEGFMSNRVMGSVT